MSIQTLTSFAKVRGTAAERAAMRLSDIPQNQEIEFIETDTGDVYTGSRDGWYQGGSAGKALVSQATLLSGEDQTNNVVRVEKQNGYELIAASTTAGVPGGGSGAIGDFLEAVIVKANTGTITILDGATTVLVIPASTTVGTRYEFNMLAKTAWKITTPASTEAICVGRFS